MVKTTLQADHTAVTLFQAAFGGRGKVCKRRAQRGCTAYGCGCHQLCGEVNSKCRRTADAPFLVFRLPLVGVARCANGVRSGAAHPTAAGVINYVGKQTANVGEPPTLHFWFSGCLGWGWQVCRSGIYARQTQTCLSFRYTTIKNVGHKCPTYLGLVFRLPLSGKQRQPENHIRAAICIKPTLALFVPHRHQAGVAACGGGVHAA